MKYFSSILIVILLTSSVYFLATQKKTPTTPMSTGDKQMGETSEAFSKNKPQPDTQTNQEKIKKTTNQATDLNIRSSTDERILKLRQLSKNWDQNSQEEVLEYLESNGEPFLQVEALLVLEKQGDKFAVPKIMPFTDEEHIILQRGAVSALGGISKRLLKPEDRTSIVHKLIEIYHREKNKQTQKSDGNAIVVLEKIGGIFHKENTTFLLEELQTETNVNTMYVLVKALSTHVSQDVVDSLDATQLKSEKHLQENPSSPEAEEYQELITLISSTKRKILNSGLLR